MASGAIAREIIWFSIVCLPLAALAGWVLERRDEAIVWKNLDRAMTNWTPAAERLCTDPFGDIVVERL